MIRTQVTHDGSKNAVLTLKGVSVAFPQPKVVLLCADLSNKPKTFHIESVTYSFSGKDMGNLWWVFPDTEYELALPLEGRGFLNFEGLQRLSPMREGSIGLALSVVADAFLAMIDLVKQYEH